MPERIQLTEAEREALKDADGWSNDGGAHQHAAVEAIIAARLDKRDCGAVGCRAIPDRDAAEARAEQAEVALADLRAKVEALADEWERTHVGQHGRSGVRLPVTAQLTDRLRTLLKDPS